MRVKNDGRMRVEEKRMRSEFLGREVKLTILLPAEYTKRPYPVLWLNDGQDIPSLELDTTISELIHVGVLREFITIGIHANEERLNEYGTLEMPDYANRGAKAGLYADFLTDELLPLVRREYNVSISVADNVIAGFSLGALSAINIAWNYSNLFGKVGVFSGSLWWRKKALSRWYKDDRDRIIHKVIQSGQKREGLKFWFEAGTEDETADRNKNGLIDSLDDTVDLIKELVSKGYDGRKDIQFVVVKGGTHNQETWKEVMPYFLKWAFG